MRIVRLLSESINKEGLSENDKDFLTKYKKSIVMPWFEKRWQEKFSGQSDKQRDLMKHLAYGLDNVGVILDKEQQLALKQLEGKIALVSLPQRLYSQLRMESNYELGKGINLRYEVGGSFSEVFDVTGRNNSVIPAFFTYNGFYDFYIPKCKEIMSMAELDTWVMGRTEKPRSFSTADIKRFQSRINELYLNDYKNTWLSAANSIKLVNFGNDLGLTVKKLNSLVVSSKPYRSLLKLIKRNTTLMSESPSLKSINTKNNKEEGKLLNIDVNVVPAQMKMDIVNPLKKYFHFYNDLLDIPDGRESAYIDDIENALFDLHSYMLDLQQRVLSDERGYALKKVMQRLKLTSDDDPFYLLYRLASGLNEPIQSQLKKISNDSWRIVLNLASNDLNDLWQSDVYNFYKENIEGRYPFRARAQAEVSPDIFREFFSSDGTVANFYNKYLSPVLMQNGVGNYPSTLVNENTNVFLKHVSAIREGLFTQKGEYGISFSIEPTDLSGVYLNSNLNIDGVSISYRHAKTSIKDMVWPNQLGTSGRSYIKVTPINRSLKPEIRQANGSWSLLRLLDTSETIALSDKTREIRFPFRAGSASYRIRVTKEMSPITKDLFSGFIVPQYISN